MVNNSNSLLQKLLFKELGSNTSLKDVSLCRGGCISSAAAVKTSKGTFFLKWGQSKEMYFAEKNGLLLLNKKSGLKIPDIINFGEIDSQAYIIMEHIEVVPATPSFWNNLGTGLAQLHKSTASKYGLDHNNFIGSLYQQNDFDEVWTDFFINNRLEVQLQLALQKQLINTPFSQEFRKIYKVIKALVPDLEPSLLHGDLWSGNILSTNNATAALIDPAVYFGSREIEIAFTYLFGGFDYQFYQSYDENFPLEPGFKDRIDLYNLYPLMVHLNMFGTGYLGAIRNTIRKYIR